MIEASRHTVPVFVDTLNDLPTTERFGEHYGSYPVLRLQDFEGRELAGRLDGNPVAGKLTVAQVVEQLERGRRAFDAR